ncbi:MAG: 30S ribosomal protein S3 [Nanoarchaeota archaeon]|nr:30S ribosomal protein S3 [Nanoarchaeota archaeon]MBU1976490.1 30S ribosomal protein S3 [Nanoarchaeota archaeon]
MIEREFIAQKTKEYYIKKYVEKTLGNVGVSSITLKKIPLGEKIIINTSRPSLIVGSKGSNIRSLTKTLKNKFKLENPQIEINEVKNIFLDADVVAEKIVSSLERFGSARFKGIGHKMLESVMVAGAKGVEIIISGKIPGARAKSWRFYMGYLKKCGDIAVVGVRKSKKAALLKSGIIGIKVSIMPSDIVLPDSVIILEEPQQLIEEIKESESENKKEKKQEKKKPAKRKSPVKKSTKKKVKGAKEEAKEIKEAKEAKEETKEAKESKEAKEVKEETKEIKEAKDGAKEEKESSSEESREENNLEVNEKENDAEEKIDEIAEEVKKE